jgi:fructose-1,6-bisphosphatase/inositol monophosphatase family enzyme
MTGPSFDLRDRLEFALDVSRRAGEITLEHFQSALDVERKADQSPVTIADREAEKYLREAIERKFPADGILGEEFGETRSGAP